MFFYCYFFLFAILHYTYNYFDFAMGLRETVSVELLKQSLFQTNKVVGME